MRKLGLALLASALVAVPQAAFSQDSGITSADEFACALAGDCPDEAAVGDEGDPATQSGSGPRVSATRGFSLSTTGNPETTTSRPRTTAPATTTTRQNRRRNTASAGARATRPVTEQERGRVDLLLSFTPGSAELSARDVAQVRAFAEALKRPQLANVRVRIEGHTDSSGGRALNQSLSERRAQAVADFLAGEGVDPSRLEVRGFGYDRPLPGRPASDGVNRRVEAVRVG